MQRPAGGQPTSPWVVCPQHSPEAPLRLFCFHHAGGEVSMYTQWSGALARLAEVCAVRLPGRGSRLTESPFTHLEPLVQAVAEALRPYLDRPFVFFGHSMGALLSFELARHTLRRYGVAPAQIIVSGHAAPQLPRSEPPVHDLPEPEFVERLRQLNGTPGEVLENDELRRLFLPVLRADFRVCETYVYRTAEPLPCPISVYGGLGDAHVSRADLEAWQEQTQARATVRMFPGDHFFVSSQRPLVLQALARELMSLTLAARSASGAGARRGAMASPA